MIDAEPSITHGRCAGPRQVKKAFAAPVKGKLSLIPTMKNSG
jgi:hypothetical protein